MESGGLAWVYYRGLMSQLFTRRWREEEEEEEEKEEEEEESSVFCVCLDRRRERESEWEKKWFAYFKYFKKRIIWSNDMSHEHEHFVIRCILYG